MENGRARSPLVLVVLTLLVVPPLFVTGWAWLALHWAYARGERAGFVQKISQKGWVCKTWEGELAMANLPGAMPEIFSFSVRDDAIAHELEHDAGQRVSLTYEQHRGLPGSCFGDTEYFITAIHSVTDSAPIASIPSNPK